MTSILQTVQEYFNTTNSSDFISNKALSKGWLTTHRELTQLELGLQYDAHILLLLLVSSIPLCL